MVEDDYVLDPREALQDAILERLEIPTTDGDINYILAALASQDFKILPRNPDEAMERAGLANAKTWLPGGDWRTGKEHLFLWSAMWEAAAPPSTAGGGR